MTAEIIDLRTRQRIEAPAGNPPPPRQVVLVTAICASLVWGDQICGQPLAYQRGTWRHPRTRHGCTDPQPARCEHECGEPADIDQRCGRGHRFCCGCCWEHEDQLEGRQLWPIW